MRKVEKTVTPDFPERYLRHGFVVGMIAWGISAQSPDAAIFASIIGFSLMAPGVVEMGLDLKTYFNDVRGRHRITPSRITY
jgi:hypothetical protein